MSDGLNWKKQGRNWLFQELLEVAAFTEIGNYLILCDNVQSQFGASFKATSGKVEMLTKQSTSSLDEAKTLCEAHWKKLVN